ncbi:MAG: HlyD family secretion protein [Mixta calida]|nr:HlyD family secretion protein [Mixta calida]
MSQQEESKAAERERTNKRRILSVAVGSGIVIVGVLIILYAWQLWPFTSAVQSTENAYVRGQVTFISPQVSGYITAVNVQDLQPVRKGDVLMTIDDRIYRQRVEQAKAQLAMKQAALANNQQQRRSAEAVIARNQAALENAKAQAVKSGFDLKRVENLVSDGSLSIRERDAARAAYSQAVTAVQQAKATVDVSRQDLQTVIVNRASLEADVANAEAALRLAQIDLDNTRIIAPEDGQLGQISVRRGAYVSAGTRLTSLVPGQKWVIANMKETQMANVRPGLPVTFTVDALNGATFHGVVEYISPAAGSEFSAISPDNATGNFVKIAQRIPVRIKINGEEQTRLRPGMSVQVSIDTSAAPVEAQP